MELTNKVYRGNEFKKIVIEVYEGLKELRAKVKLKDLVDDFIIKNRYRTDNYGHVKLVPIKGWIVIKLPKALVGPSSRIIDHEKFETLDEAKSFFDEYYPNSVDEKFFKEICYEGIIGFNAKTRKGKDIVGDYIDQSLSESHKRIYDKVSEFIKKYDNPNNIPNINYPSLDDAKTDFENAVDSNIIARGNTIKRITEDKSGEGELYIVGKETWGKEKGTKTSYPKIPKPINEVNNPKPDDIEFLIHMHEYLFNKIQPTIAEALARGHMEISQGYIEGDIKPREPLNGVDVISITENSDFKNTIARMAKNGFDMQPIIDTTQNCVGAIKLQDVLKVISEIGISSLPETFDLAELTNLNLLRPIPPLLDARAPLVEAENILKSGTDAILVRFNKKTWFGDCPKIVIDTLKDGLHIMTSHDIAAYYLTD